MVRGAAAAGRRAAVCAYSHRRTCCCSLRPSAVPPNLPVLLPAGTDFEKRILANEANNQKFNFLKDGDPYNAYYRKRVRCLATGHLQAVCCFCKWPALRFCCLHRPDSAALRLPFPHSAGGRLHS